MNLVRVQWHRTSAWCIFSRCSSNWSLPSSVTFCTRCPDSSDTIPTASSCAFFGFCQRSNHRSIGGQRPVLQEGLDVGPQRRELLHPWLWHQLEATCRAAVSSGEVQIINPSRRTCPWCLPCRRGLKDLCLTLFSSRRWRGTRMKDDSEEELAIQREERRQAGSSWPAGCRKPAIYESLNGVVMNPEDHPPGQPSRDHASEDSHDQRSSHHKGLASDDRPGPEGEGHWGAGPRLKKTPVPSVRVKLRSWTSTEENSCATCPAREDPIAWIMSMRIMYFVCIRIFWNSSIQVFPIFFYHSR